MEGPLHRKKKLKIEIFGISYRYHQEYKGMGNHLGSSSQRYPQVGSIPHIDYVQAEIYKHFGFVLDGKKWYPNSTIEQKIPSVRISKGCRLVGQGKEVVYTGHKIPETEQQSVQIILPTGFECVCHVPKLQKMHLATEMMFQKMCMENETTVDIFPTHKYLTIYLSAGTIICGMDSDGNVWSRELSGRTPYDVGG